MKQTFEEADKNGDGLLNIEEIYQLLHKLNVNLPRRKVKQMFQVCGEDWNIASLKVKSFHCCHQMWLYFFRGTQMKIFCNIIPSLWVHINTIWSSHEKWAFVYVKRTLDSLEKPFTPIGWKWWFTVIKVQNICIFLAQSSCFASEDIESYAGSCMDYYNDGCMYILWLHYLGTDSLALCKLTKIFVYFFVYVHLRKERHE